MADDLKINEQIAKYAKAFNDLPPEKHTVENAMKIFDLLNTNRNNASKDRLDDVDKIDDYFKGVMGLSVMNNTISKEDFLENIDDWVGEFAKYEAPKPTPKAAEPPFKKVEAKKAKELADNLLYKLSPLGASGSVMAYVADWFGDDDGRYDDAMALFGPGEDKINQENIVEILNKSKAAELNRVIGLLDGSATEGAEAEIRGMIGVTLQDRIDTLKEKKLITDAEYKKAQGYIDNISTNSNFVISINRICTLLDGKGVK